MTWEPPTFNGITDELELFLSDAIFIAHNVNFDHDFFKVEFARINILFNMDRLCSMQLSRAPHLKYRSHALDRIIERMNLRVINRHRACDDAEVIWKFFSSEMAKNELKLYRFVNKCLNYTHE